MVGIAQTGSGKTLAVSFWELQLKNFIIHLHILNWFYEFYHSIHYQLLSISIINPIWSLVMDQLLSSWPQPESWLSRFQQLLLILEALLGFVTRVFLEVLPKAHRYVLAHSHLILFLDPAYISFICWGFYWGKLKDRTFDSRDFFSPCSILDLSNNISAISDYLIIHCQLLSYVILNAALRSWSQHQDVWLIFWRPEKLIFVVAPTWFLTKLIACWTWDLNLKLEKF